MFLHWDIPVLSPTWLSQDVRYEHRQCPRRRPAHLAGGREYVCVLIFLPSSATLNFAAPRLWGVDARYELTCFCYSKGKARGRAARSWTCCFFAAGGDGRDGHLLLREDSACVCLAPSPGSDRSGWILQGLGRCRIGSGAVTQLLCCVRGLLQCSFTFIADMESAQDQRG